MFRIFTLLIKIIIVKSLVVNRKKKTYLNSDSLDNFFSDFPVLINTAIILFKNTIIYDRFIIPEEINLGKNIIAEINDYNKQA
jgi:hypothetical protein